MSIKPGPVKRPTDSIIMITSSRFGSADNVDVFSERRVAQHLLHSLWIDVSTLCNGRRPEWGRILQQPTVAVGERPHRIKNRLVIDVKRKVRNPGRLRYHGQLPMDFCFSIPCRLNLQSIESRC